MLWDTGVRSVDNGLIGFTNGHDMTYVEVQGEYRPDQRLQTTGQKKKADYGTTFCDQRAKICCVAV